MKDIYVKLVGNRMDGSQAITILEVDLKHRVNGTQSNTVGYASFSMHNSIDIF